MNDFDKELSSRQKQTIRKRVQRAINRGEITRPSNCEQCGGDNNGQTLDAHHEDYNNPLEVTFLCRDCHNKIPKQRSSAQPASLRVYVIEQKIIRSPKPLTFPTPTSKSPNSIIYDGKEYTRETHPLLFAVVDWLEVTPEHRQSSVRKIAAEFESSTARAVSKSWAAVAKNYWQSQAEK